MVTENFQKTYLKHLDVMTLLSLPDHLRKTAVSLCKLEKATADEVAEQTKRARAVESGYLNQLVIMGYYEKGKSKAARHTSMLIKRRHKQNGKNYSSSLI